MDLSAPHTLGCAGNWNNLVVAGQKRVIICIEGREIFEKKFSMCVVKTFPFRLFSRNGHGDKVGGDVEMKETKKTRS